MKKEIREDVVEAFKPTKFGWSNKYMAYDLCNQLMDNEQAIKIVFTKINRMYGLLAATSDRLIFTAQQSKLLQYGNKIVLNYSQITSMDVNQGQIFATLVINTASAHYAFGNMSSDEAAEIMRIVNNAANTVKVKQEPISQSPAERLLQLKQLLDAGILTDDEYDAKAAEIKALL